MKTINLLQKKAIKKIKILTNKILNISLVTNIIKKFDLYAYSFQKRVYINDIVIRLNIFIL